MWRRIVWLGFWATMVALSGAGTARAAPPPTPPTGASAAPAASSATIAADAAKARAQEHFDRANQLIEAHAWDGALAEFRAAYGSFPSPKILYNQAEVECELGRFVDAAAHYETFLREFAPADGDEDAQRIEEARQAARVARAKIATIEPAAAGGVEVLVDARSFGKTPLVQPIPVDPGRHRVSFRQAGLVDSSREVSLSPGQQLRLAPDPITIQAAEPAPPKRSFLQRWPFWVVTGVVILGGAAATFAATRSGRPSCPLGATCTNGE
jgi:hypothetical protein